MANVRRESAPAAVAIPLASSVVGLTPGALNCGDPHQVLGTLQPGFRTVLLSKGAFGMADLVDALLEQTGPADLLLATWTIGAREITAFRDLVASGRVCGLRLLVDASFPSRNKAYTAKLRASFGADCIRLAVCHAKVAVLTNVSWAITVLSSANLNRNSRLEFYSVEDNRALATDLVRVLGTWFETPAADQWDASMTEHTKRLAAWGESANPARLLAQETTRETGRPARRPGRRSSSPQALAPATVADAAFFEDSPYGTDLRRAGISFVR